MSAADVGRRADLPRLKTSLFAIEYEQREQVAELRAMALKTIEELQKFVASLDALAAEERQ